MDTKTNHITLLVCTRVMTGVMQYLSRKKTFLELFGLLNFVYSQLLVYVVFSGIFPRGQIPNFEFLIGTTILMEVCLSNLGRTIPLPPPACLEINPVYYCFYCFCVLCCCCYYFQNWIGNERRRRKGLDTTQGRQPPKKPPQKLRAPMAYHLFVKNFFKSAGKYGIFKLKLQQQISFWTFELDLFLIDNLTRFRINHDVLLVSIFQYVPYFLECLPRIQ